MQAVVADHTMPRGRKRRRQAAGRQQMVPYARPAAAANAAAMGPPPAAPRPVRNVRNAARRAAYWRKKNYPSDRYYARYFPRTDASKRRYGEYYRTALPGQRQRRNMDRMYGRGGFWGNIWEKVRTPFYDAVGVGVKAAAPWASGLVDATREEMKAAGYGAYTANSLVNAGAHRASGVPSFGPESDTGAVTVVHRKFVRDIFAPTDAADAKDFQSQQIHINPGLEESFPWLSQVAANYDAYHLNQCIFTFKSTVAEFQTTTGIVGDILMAVQYNKHDKPFSDTHRMKEFHGSVCGKSTDTILCGVECDPGKTAGDDLKFIRYQGLPESEDKQDYDKGILTFATSNLPSQLAGQKIGELWVSYNVTMLHPKLVTADAAAVRQDICFHASDGTKHAMGVAGETDNGAVPASGDLIIWSNGLNAYRHQHNSIGCRIANAPKLALQTVPTFGNSNMELIASKMWSPSNARCQGIEVEFPPEEHGDFEIILRVVSSGNYTASMTNPGYTLGGVQAWRAAGANVEPIKDMLVGAKRGEILAPFTSEISTTGAGVDTQSSKVVDGGTSSIDSYIGLETDKQTNSYVEHQVAMMKVHVRVKPVTAGERNVLKLQMQAMAVAGDDNPANRLLIATTVEIKEYNALDDLDLAKGFVNKAGSTLVQVTGGKAKADDSDDFMSSNM